MSKTFKVLVQGIEEPYMAEATGFNACASTILSNPSKYPLKDAKVDGVVGIENVATGGARFYMLRGTPATRNLYPISASTAATMFSIAA